MKSRNEIEGERSNTKTFMDTRVRNLVSTQVLILLSNKS